MSEKIRLVEIIKKIWKQEGLGNPSQDELDWTITQFLKDHKKLEEQVKAAQKILKEWWSGKRSFTSNRELKEL